MGMLTVQMVVGTVIKMPLLRLAILAVIGWYLFLITCHYFSFRLFWNDELCVFANISQKPLGNLFFHPLTHDQEFPRVYLYLIGLLAKNFNDSLLAVRFLPFISMLFAFLIWINLAQKQIKSNLGLLTFILCWTASDPLIYYAAELKQYSMDVLVAGLFLLFLYHQDNLRRNLSAGMYLASLCLLSLTCLFSYIAFLFMLFPLFNLWKSSRENRGEDRFFWSYLGSCLIGFLIVLLIDFKSSHSELLLVYWKEYFISFDSLGDFFRSFQEVINNTISRWFAEKPKWIRIISRIIIGSGLIYLIVEGVSRFKKKTFRFVSILDVAFFLLCICLILSALKKFPLGVPRMTLFFAPILLISTVSALEWLSVRNQLMYRFVQYPFLVFLVYVSVGLSILVCKGDLGAQSTIWQ